MTNKDDIAALRAEVEALKAAAPKPQPTAEERERATREWMSEMHTMREGRMAMAMPPSVVRDFAVLDDRLVKEITLRDARAPTSPQSAIPTSRQFSGGGSANVAGSGTGWAHETPIGPPPGLRYVDAQLDAQDARDRAELIAREAKLRAMEKATEQSEKLQKLIEENKKLAERIR
jgi:hypothetical protein